MSTQHPQHTPARAISRRSVAAGLAWAAPAVAMTAAAPAFAASTTLTATNVTPQTFIDRYYWVTQDCSQSGGFINTQATAVTGSPRNRSDVPDSDGKLSPSSSIGYWLETSNTNSGVARIDSVTTVFTFPTAITIDACPDGKYNNGSQTDWRGTQYATWSWTQCTTLNGWTYALSADGKTLTLTYNKPTIVNTSTSAPGSGTALPGYFINYRAVSRCATTGTVTYTSTMVYSTKTLSKTSWKKSFSGPMS